LAAVPFVLGILLRLLSGRDLFVFFLGQTADAWVLSGLTMYGAILLGSTFSQNSFAYDGHGFAVFVTAPLDLGLVLRAKNLVPQRARGLRWQPAFSTWRTFDAARFSTWASPRWPW
jgi:ABC-2 type transport system permease protein